MKQKSYPVYIIVSLLVLLIFSSACIFVLVPRMFESDYTYEISIVHYGPLSNATFVIPLPVKDNSAKLTSEIYTKSDFIYPDAKVLLTQSPDGLDRTDMSPFPGYDPWFLIIRIAEPVSNSSLPYTPPYIYHFEKDIRVKLDNPDFPVKTMTPIGNETLIAPKYNFSWQNPPLTEKRGYYTNTYSPASASIPYTTKISADYDAPDPTIVIVSCRVEGRNSWVQGYDDWLENNYHDEYSMTFSGGSHGWYETKGNLVVAEGYYH